MSRIVVALRLVVLLQAVLGIRMVARLARTAQGETIPRAEDSAASGRISIVVPVLNERDRLAPCLDGLISQGDAAHDILVVDGGSTDGTQTLINDYATRDPRVHLIDASPIPDGWNGKAWGLQRGLDATNPACEWVLTIDADVRPTPALAHSLLAHAGGSGLSVLSVATRQEISGAGQGLLHPSMLTTLVYRFGIPGGRYRRAADVQANGQCFLARRDTLVAVGGFASVRDSICEDITIARRLVECGVEVGFFETDGLVSVRMHSDWRDTWRNWPRSLPMRDRYWGMPGALGLAEVLLVQALPLPLYVWLRLTRRGQSVAAIVNGSLLITRLGVLAGTSRAYVERPWTYWLSPLADLPVAIRITTSAMRRRHTWRGRTLVRGG
jgi:dolichol-phosphate mannosyltransferase